MTDSAVTVRFRITTDTYGTKTFATGKEAADFIHNAIAADIIVNLSIVSGPGTTEYSKRTAQIYADRRAAHGRLAAIVAESVVTD